MKLRKLLRTSFLSLAFFAASHQGVKAQDSAERRDTHISVRADNGEVLFEKNADKKAYPASTVKIMTAYLTFKALKEGKITEDQMLGISWNAAGIPVGYVELDLQAGGKISTEDALKGMMVKSANDAAIVLAEAIGGTEQQFIQIMNKTAKELGMNNTHFTNPNGIRDADQYTTLNDMVILVRALLNEFPEEYKKYCGIKKFTYNGRTYTNYNNLLGSYDGVDGLKTGYIATSGFNIVCSAEKDGVRLIVIRFGASNATERKKDVVWLLNKSFSKIEMEKHIEVKKVDIPPMPTLDTLVLQNPLKPKS